MSQRHWPAGAMSHPTFFSHHLTPHFLYLISLFRTFTTVPSSSILRLLCILVRKLKRSCSLVRTRPAGRLHSPLVSSNFYSTT